MLDLSIPKLEKCTTEREYENFLRVHYTVTEKFDGTKLTLLKTGSSADDWLLAYKGNVLPKALFKHIILDGSNWRYTYNVIKKQSAGFLQYILVFDHLLAIDVQLAQIPANTEVFIEFIQRKSTVLSEYARVHDMFVISAAPCEWNLDTTGSRVTTFPRHGNSALMDTVTRALALRQPRVLFDGSFGSEVARHGSLLNLPRVSDFAGWKEHQDALFEALVSFESTLGGRPEGVVLASGNIVQKVVRADQCDKLARGAKKSKFRYADPLAEADYWKRVVSDGNTLVRNIMTSAPGFRPKTLEEAYKILAKIMMRYRPTDANLVSPRSEINMVEDVMLTAKLHLERAMWTKDVGSIGVFVMAGKPVHLGHWKMIKRAAYENDKLLLVVSTADRDFITGEDMFRVWMEFLALELPKNVILRFSASPYLDAVYELKSLSEETTARLAVYGDPHDIEKSWNPDVIRKKLPNLADDRLWVFPITRESVIEISGTDMRRHIREHDRDEFMKNLPPLDDAKKQRYWDIVSKR